MTELPDDLDVDLDQLSQAHELLGRDLQALADQVAQASVADRSTWVVLQRDWDRFALATRQRQDRERRHLWPLVDRLAPGPHAQVDERLRLAGARSDLALTLVESCRAVLGRLATARDEDAAATLRARVGAAREVLELESADFHVLVASVEPILAAPLD